MGTVAVSVKLFAFRIGSWQDVGIFVASTLAALTATFVILFIWNLLIRAPQAAVRERDQKLKVRDALRAGIKAALGKAQDRGEYLLPLNDKTEAENWVKMTHSLIENAFGAAEATVFLSDAGFTFFSANGRVKNWIGGRLNRLVSLIQRCDTIPLCGNATLPSPAELSYFNRPVTPSLSDQ